MPGRHLGAADLLLVPRVLDYVCVLRKPAIARKAWRQTHVAYASDDSGDDGSDGGSDGGSGQEHTEGGAAAAADPAAADDDDPAALTETDDPRAATRAVVEHRYPPVDHDDIDFPAEVLDLFCFPGADPCALRASRHPLFSSFVLTDAAGHRTYVSSLLWLAADDAGRRWSKSMCLIGRIPLYSLHEAVLMETFAMLSVNVPRNSARLRPGTVVDVPERVLKFLVTMAPVPGFQDLLAMTLGPHRYYYALGVPPPPAVRNWRPPPPPRGGPANTQTTNRADTPPPRPPPPRPPPRLPDLSLPHVDDACFSVLFRCLSPDTVVRVVECLLQEQRVLFHSSRAHRLTAVCEAVTALIHPLDWNHVFIPVLPHDLLHYIEAPMSYVIGVETSCLDSPEWEDLSPQQMPALVVDIDNSHAARFNDQAATAATSAAEGRGGPRPPPVGFSRGIVRQLERDIYRLVPTSLFHGDGAHLHDLAGQARQTPYYRSPTTGLRFDYRSDGPNKAPPRLPSPAAAAEAAAKAAAAVAAAAAAEAATAAQPSTAAAKASTAADPASAVAWMPLASARRRSDSDPGSVPTSVLCGSGHNRWIDEVRVLFLRALVSLLVGHRVVGPGDTASWDFRDHLPDPAANGHQGGFSHELDVFDTDAFVATVADGASRPLVRKMLATQMFAQFAVNFAATPSVSAQLQRRRRRRRTPSGRGKHPKRLARAHSAPDPRDGVGGDGDGDGDGAGRGRPSSVAASAQGETDDGGAEDDDARLPGMDVWAMFDAVAAMNRGPSGPSSPRAPPPPPPPQPPPPPPRTPRTPRGQAAGAPPPPPRTPGTAATPHQHQRSASVNNTISTRGPGHSPLPAGRPPPPRPATPFTPTVASPTAASLAARPPRILERMCRPVRGGHPVAHLRSAGFRAASAAFAVSPFKPARAHEVGAVALPGDEGPGEEEEEEEDADDDDADPEAKKQRQAAKKAAAVAAAAAAKEEYNRGEARMRMAQDTLSVSLLDLPAVPRYELRVADVDKLVCHTCLWGTHRVRELADDLYSAANPAADTEMRVAVARMLTSSSSSSSSSGGGGGGGRGGEGGAGSNAGGDDGGGGGGEERTASADADGDTVSPLRRLNSFRQKKRVTLDAKNARPARGGNRLKQRRHSTMAALGTNNLSYLGITEGHFAKIKSSIWSQVLPTMGRRCSVVAKRGRRRGSIIIVPPTAAKPRSAGARPTGAAPSDPGGSGDTLRRSGALGTGEGTPSSFHTPTGAGAGGAAGRPPMSKLKSKVSAMMAFRRPLVGGSGGSKAKFGMTPKFSTRKRVPLSRHKGTVSSMADLHWNAEREGVNLNRVVGGVDLGSPGGEGGSSLAGTSRARGSTSMLSPAMTVILNTQHYKTSADRMRALAAERKELRRRLAASEQGMKEAAVLRIVRYYQMRKARRHGGGVILPGRRASGNGAAGKTTKKVVFDDIEADEITDVNHLFL